MSIDISLLPQRYQKQIADQLGAPVVGVAVGKPTPAQDGKGGQIVEIRTTGAVTKRPRLQQKRGGLNKTEAAFLEYLRATKPNCNPRREGCGIRIGNGCVYWPDFVISAGVEKIEAYEVKGGLMQDDAAAKLKAAARTFPEIAFYLVTKKRKKDGGGWIIEEVLP